LNLLRAFAKEVPVWVGPPEWGCSPTWVEPMSTETSSHVNDYLFMGTQEHLRIGGSPPGITP
jgi:hypothetical protein